MPILLEIESAIGEALRQNHLFRKGIACKLNQRPQIAGEQEELELSLRRVF
jgi:hypothetical protein